mmetsp:Transcript_33127/g.101140  ORF Transcript_33127/g.101140 Transcript_33127/m.101140 type:complete len:228 (+) Transcript_33127:112-795(+)
MIVIVLNRSLYALKLLSNLVIACPINHPYAYRPRRLCPTPNAPTDQPRSSEARQRRRLETRVHDVAVGIRVPLLGHRWVRNERGDPLLLGEARDVHVHRAVDPLLREQPSGGGPHHVRVRLPRPRRLAQCPAGRAQHALRARRRRRVPPSRDVRAEVEEDEAVRRRETPLHQLHQRSKRARRASLERDIVLQDQQGRLEVRAVSPQRQVRRRAAALPARHGHRPVHS